MFLWIPLEAVRIPTYNSINATCVNEREEKKEGERERDTERKQDRARESKREQERARESKREQERERDIEKENERNSCMAFEGPIRVHVLFAWFVKGTS